jgi:hypothetical protein
LAKNARHRTILTGLVQWLPANCERLRRSHTILIAQRRARLGASKAHRVARATRIIDLTSTGVIDAEALAKRVVAESHLAASAGSPQVIRRR